MPRTPEQFEEIRKERKQQIAAVALDLFAGQGYNATSISQLAEKAGISKGLIYNYFQSKEELLETIWDELMADFDVIIDPDNDGEVTDSEAGFFIDALFEMLKNRREQWKLYYQLSFQPQVIEFLKKKYANPKGIERVNLIYNYFSNKVNVVSPEFRYFSVVAFMKGLSMVATYSESMFPNEFIEKYKEELKKILINK